MKIPKPIKWLAALVGIPFMLVLLSFGGFIVYNLVRPISPPSSFNQARASSMARAEKGATGSALQNVSALQGASASPQNKLHQYELVPEAAQTTSEFMAKAGKINRVVEQLRKDVDTYSAQRKLWNKKNDQLSKELVSLSGRIDMEYALIKSEMASFSPELQARWDDVYLDLLMSKKEWGVAAHQCLLNDITARGRFNNWDTEVYCYRQMGKWRGGVLIPLSCCMRLYTKVKSGVEHAPAPR